MLGMRPATPRGSVSAQAGPACGPGLFDEIGRMTLCAVSLALASEGAGECAGPLFSSGPAGYAGYALPGAGREASPRVVERISETALATLYQKYAPAIYAHCRRMLQSQAAARDATQEAFVRVLTRGPQFPNDDDGLRYLYRVSTNVCLNQIRELKVHTRAAASLRVRPSSSGSMEGRHVDRDFVAAVLDRCGEAGARVAVMHYVDGMSQVEIAEVLGITRRTVFNRLRRVARIARDLLGAAQPEGETREGHS
jgi:RNA polymerase sigma-70 factor (ECF subfamily)